MLLSEMYKLEKNWDSYGAERPDDATIEKATLMLSILERYGGHWDCVPCSSGGIQIEMHQYGWDIELSIERSTSNTGVDAK
jgi:hypothetical protein